MDGAAHEIGFYFDFISPFAYVAWTQVHGIAARKNDEVLERIRRDGVTVYPGSRRYLEAATHAGHSRPCAL